MCESPPSTWPKLALRIAIASALGVDLAALATQPEPRPDLDDHVRTALLRTMSNEELSAAPLTPTELEGVPQERFRRPRAHRSGPYRRLSTPHRPPGERRNYRRPGTSCPRLVSGWLGELESIFGAIDGPADPRFITSVVLSAGKALIRE